MAPPLGPVIGGVIDARLGWPYIFWFLNAFSGLCLALLISTLPETARRIVGNGSIRPWGFYKSLLTNFGMDVKYDMLRMEARMACTYPISLLIY